MHQSSLDEMLNFKNKYLESSKDKPLLVFDLGSQDVNGSYRKYFNASPWKYYGIDVTPGKNVDIVLKDYYKWSEIKSDSADVLISGQAFEHIEFFWITMLEIARVLKPGGLCCIIAPSGGFEHRYPMDCWRFYTDGFVALARFAKLEVIEASTRWASDAKYTDDSNLWKDTVLVCRKPYLLRFDTWKEKIRRILLHRILTMGLRPSPLTISKNR